MDFTPINSHSIKNKRTLLTIEKESILKMYTSIMDLKRPSEIVLFFKYEVYTPDVQEYYLKCRHLLILALVEQSGCMKILSEYGIKKSEQETLLEDKDFFYTYASINMCKGKYIKVRRMLNYIKRNKKVCPQYYDLLERFKREAL